jgi:cytochrome c551
MKNIIFGISILLAACQSAEEVKRNQYFVEGLELYKTHCANCHQLDGAGLAGLYPPIVNSDFLAKNKMKVICLMQNGSTDTSSINGKIYKQKMPSNKKLEPLEIAELTTYLYNRWGGETVFTNIEDTKKALENCK